MIRSFVRFPVLSLAIVCGFTSLHAQSPIGALRPLPQSNRVAANADLGPQTQLTGHIPGWVSNGTPAAQPVNLSANMSLTIVLQRDPAVQAAFVQFLADQQTPGNPLYHQWLTPQQVGTLFGPTASDLAAVTSWLTSQGLTVDEVQPNQIMINVSGTTSAIASTFRTSFGYFPLNGVSRFSAVSEPSVPAALAPVVGVVFGLTDLPLYPNSFRTAPHQSTFATAPGSTTPVAQPNYNSSTGTHYMSPGDFAIVYDSASVLAGGNKGAGANAHVAVIGRSRVAATDISEFATNMGIGSSYTLNTIIPGNGTDPGPVCTYANANTCTTSGDQGEQTLDVDRVVGNAPNATVDLIVATSLTTALQWNVNTVKDPIMTISYGGCEAQTGGVAAAQTYDTYYSTGAAEGISTFVSSGDSGANGCAPAFTAVSTASAYGPSPNYLCSSSYVTCVGGTIFIDTVASTYWNSTNTTASNGMIGSALSYIPEGAWNEPGTSSPYQTAGTGGGASLAIAKPIWQIGTGTVADGHRDTPDVAYPAAQHDSYYACLDFQLGSYAGQGSPPITSSSNCTTAGGGYFFGFSGTSAAAPAMAGVTALLDTKLGIAQGNLNPLLYTLAAIPSNNVFHDITPTSSGVGGACVITTPSVCNNSTPGSSALSTAATGGMQGFLVGTGYDQATGLGSIDVANFLVAASAKVSTTLAVTATSSTIAAGGSDTFTATLTRSSSTPGAATGTVQFYNGGIAFGSAVTISNNVATSAATTFSTAGTDSITAIYSGDTNYATSTSPTYTLTVTAAPTFSVIPASTTYNLISGVTTGNTDVITFASLNTFAGTVNYTCSATGVAGASCALLPTSGTLTSGGNTTSTLTITTTPGTSGVLNVTVTGTSGSTVVTSSTIAVTLTASSYTMSASPSTISIAGNATTGNTTSVTITSVNGFAGTVTVTCASSVTTIATCTGGSAAVTAATPGHVTITVTPILHTSGSSTLTISGTGTTTGATIAATASTTAALTVTTVNSTTTVVAAPTTVVAGSPTVLTATVTGASANGTPTGSVTFYSGTALTPLMTTLGMGTLSTTAGVTTATYTYTPAAGSASATAVAITASYAGDSGYNASTSAATNLTVSGTTAAVTAGSNLSFTSGATTGNTATITFTSVGGYAGAIAASCSITATSGSPANPATCAASAPAAITAGGTTTTTITITSTTAHGKISGPQQAGLTGWGIRGGAVLAMLICLVPFRRRRFIRSLAAFVLLACGLVVISGCSSSTPAAKQSSAGTYTLSVTGTSGTATATTTTTVTIN